MGEVGVKIAKTAGLFTLAAVCICAFSWRSYRSNVGRSKSEWAEILNKRDEKGGLQCALGRPQASALELEQQISISDPEGKIILLPSRGTPKELEIPSKTIIALAERYFVVTEDSRLREKGASPVDLRTFGAFLKDISKNVLRGDFSSKRGYSGLVAQVTRGPNFDRQECGGYRRAQSLRDKWLEWSRSQALVEYVAGTKDLKGKSIGEQGALNKIIEHYFYHVPLGPVNGWDDGLKIFFNVTLVEKKVKDGANKVVFQQATSQGVRSLEPQEEVAIGAALCLIATNPSLYIPTAEGYKIDSDEHLAYINMLNKLKRAGKISENQYNFAKGHPPKLNPPPGSFKYNHDRAAVIVEAQSSLSDPASAQQGSSGDAQTITTISSTVDAEAQQYAEEALKSIANNVKNKGASVVEGAFLVVDQDGKVVAQHGIGPDKLYNYARQGRYPLNSVMKALVVWAYLAGDSNRSLDDQIFDGQLQGFPEAPKNVDGESRGYISIRQALVESRNQALCNLFNDPAFVDVKGGVFEILRLAGIELSETEKQSTRFPLGYVAATPEQVAKLFIALETGSVFDGWTRVNDFTLKDGRRVTGRIANYTKLNYSQLEAARKVKEALGGVIKEGGTAASVQQRLGEVEGYAKTGSGDRSVTFAIAIKIGDKWYTIVAMAQARGEGNLKNLYSSNSVVAHTIDFIRKFGGPSAFVVEPNSPQRGTGGTDEKSTPRGESSQTQGRNRDRKKDNKVWEAAKKIGGVLIDIFKFN